MQPAAQIEQQPKTDFRPYIGIGVVGLILGALTAIQWIAEARRADERQPFPGTYSARRRAA